MSATTTVTGSVCDREQGGDFLSEVEVREIAVGLEEGEASYKFIFITTELGATKKAEPRGRLRPYSCATSCAASHSTETAQKAMSVTTTWGASSRRSAHRPPADVDVLIGPDGMGTILSVLVETQGYQGPYENPSPLHFQGPMGKLDLLSTGEYGSLDGVVDLGGLPVATLESLKSSKEKSKTTADEEMKDLLKFETEESEVYKEWKAEFEKAASDLLHIEQLLKHLH